MVEKACPKCYKITDNELCPLCGAKTSRTWTGMIVVLDPDESTIAKELNINSPGRYALKVRK